MLYFIVNQKSGNGKAGKIWRKLESKLQAKGMAYRVVYSSDAVEACEKVREAARERDAEADVEQRLRIVVVGGDGTVHGLLPALIDTGLPLGVIPAGSGNDFARSLQIPFDPEMALDIAVHASVRRIDCIRAYGTYSITVVGVGLDAQVAQSVNEAAWKRWFNTLHLGFLAYVVSLLHVLITYRPMQVRIIVDGTEKIFDQVWLMTAANMQYFGGGMKISPNSKLDDGLLDIVVVHGLNRLELLKAFPKVYRGTHLDHPNVSFLSGSQVEATATQPLLAHGDGEVLGKTPAVIQACASRLKVLCSSD